MVAYIEPSVTLFLFLFYIFCVVGHLTFFHIYFNYVYFGLKEQNFYMHVKELEIISLPKPIENS